jgi:hypothetical protein
MAENPPPPPLGRYRRGLEGANFSLEANTESVPADGRFYLLREGQVVLEAADFTAALEAYNGLCREFWECRLEDESPQVRLAAAWGMLGLDSQNKDAMAVIQRDGSPQERKRLDQAQSRRRALNSRNAAAKTGAR